MKKTKTGVCSCCGYIGADRKFSVLEHRAGLFILATFVVCSECSK